MPHPCPFRLLHKTGRTNIKIIRTAPDDRVGGCKIPSKDTKGVKSPLLNCGRGARVPAGGWCGLAPHYNSQFMILDTVNGHNKASPTSAQPAV